MGTGELETVERDGLESGLDAGELPDVEQEMVLQDGDQEMELDAGELQYGELETEEQVVGALEADVLQAVERLVVERLAVEQLIVGSLGCQYSLLQPFLPEHVPHQELRLHCLQQRLAQHSFAGEYSPFEQTNQCHQNPVLALPASPVLLALLA